MKEFYFVYRAKKTSRCLPYRHGYTKVIAKDMYDACELFRMVHPDIGGVKLNCTCVLTAEEFYNNDLYSKDKCQEIISLNYEKQNSSNIYTNADKGQLLLHTAI